MDSLNFGEWILWHGYDSFFVHFAFNISIDTTQHSDQFRDECEFDFNVYSSWNSICFEGLIAVQVSVK